MGEKWSYFRAFMDTKKLCILASIAILALMAIASYKPYIELEIVAPAPQTQLRVYFHNDKPSQFDEVHRSHFIPLSVGDNRVRVYVPSNSSFSSMRLDVSNNADGLSLCSLTLKNSWLTKYRLNGEALQKSFSSVNEIYATTLNNSNELVLVDVREGAWLYSENLLQAGDNYLDFFPLSYFVLFLVFTSITLTVILQYKRQKPNNLASIKSGAICLAVMVVVSFCIAYLFDQVFLALCVKIVFSLPFDLLRSCFRPVLVFSWIRIYFWGIWAFLLLLLLLLGKEKSVKYRYVLAVGIFALLVIGKFTTSSVGAFDSMLLGNTLDFTSNVLFGMPQGIRADEWAIEKPYYFAQAMNGLPYFNSNLALNGYDMVIASFAPVKHLMILAKPSLWGFLFLPVEYAFSFYWFFRVIALFMGAYELMNIFNPNFKYAQFTATAFVFSPAIQWLLSQWLIDIIIAGMFFVVIWKQFIISTTVIKKALAIMGCCLFANMYIYVMYPAAQIPFAYVFLSILIFVTWEYRKFFFNRANILGLGIIISAIVGMAIMFLANSYNALQVITNTIYPGSNRVWSVLPWDYELLQLTVPFFSWLKPSNYLNNSEAGQFFYCLPLMLVAGFIILKQYCNMSKSVKKVCTALALLCIPAFTLFVSQYLQHEYGFVKIVFLGLSYPRRISYATGFAFFWILQIIVSIFVDDDFKSISKVKIGAVACCLASLVLFLSWQSTYIVDFFKAKNGVGACLLLLTVIIICIPNYYLLCGRKGTYIFILFYTVSVVVSTVWVNPLTTGLDSIYNKSLMTMVRDIDAASPGAWITSGNAGIGNLVTAQGVKRRSGYYYYPDIPMMNIIDPEGKFEHLWNSFTAVDMRLTAGENYIESPESNVAIIVYINLDTAKKLGIKYILCNNSVELPEEYLNAQVIIQRYRDSVDSWSIYEIQYVD